VFLPIVGPHPRGGQVPQDAVDRSESYDSPRSPPGVERVGVPSPSGFILTNCGV